MSIIDVINNKAKNKDLFFSVEIIPPRNGTLLSKTLKKIDSLAQVQVDFISVTKGAGGSLRGGTIPIAYLIKNKWGIETMAHMTCIDTSVEELENELIDHWYLEIDNILALRGDPPRDATLDYMKCKNFHYHKYAKDLVTQIKNMNKGKYLPRKSDYKKKNLAKDKKFRKGAHTNFSVFVAGHPEGYPDCPDPNLSIEYLKQKVDSGAEAIITQMVFSAKVYDRFVKAARKAGIKVPIIPGVRPITKINQIPFIENFFHVKIGDNLKKELLPLDKEKVYKKGLQLTRNLCIDLIKAGAPGIHFYLMNDVSASKYLIGQMAIKQRNIVH